MSDTVRVACTSCGQAYKVPPTKLGQQAVCKRCGKPFIIAETSPVDLSRVQPEPRPPVAPTTATLAPAVDAEPSTFESQFSEVAPRSDGFGSLFGKIKGAVAQAAQGARDVANRAQSQVSSSFGCSDCGNRLVAFEVAAKLGRCAPCALRRTDLIDAGAGDPIFTQFATYKGGMPDFPDGAGQNGFAYIFEDALRFIDHRMKLAVPNDRIRGIDQETYQISGARAVLAGINAVALKQVRNTLAIWFVDAEGFNQVVRFQIHGAITIPGEEAKATEFLAYLSRFRSRWMTSAASSAGEEGIDMEARLERLDRLREKGLIAPEEYAAKRASLLDLL